MWSVLVRCFVSKEEDGYVSFSSLILNLCCVHSRERPVWSCGVVEWIGRPLISPTPSPGHRQVTCMFVSHTRGCLGAGVCVYVYWSNLHVYVYILQVDTHEVVMCVDRMICTTVLPVSNGHLAMSSTKIFSNDS